tara:strand:+ start:38258 stop:38995 length:738 start_codon:yes stop_codon:yes gene_type:complete
VSALKNAKRKVLKSEIVRRCACWLAAQYMRFVWATGRWDALGVDKVDELYNAGTPFIVSFWHGRLLMTSFGWQRERPFHMLISAHRDGELIAHTVKHLGIDWIKGSTAKEGKKSKGGAQALRSMLKALKEGAYVGITPDGPRGPRMRASDGVITVARMSGAPIIPLTYGVRGGRVLNTWDRFLIPYPFSKGVLYWGEPMDVSKDDDLEAARVRLEQRLTEMTTEADQMTGRATVAPADEMWERTE